MLFINACSFIDLIIDDIFFFFTCNRNTIATFADILHQETLSPLRSNVLNYRSSTYNHIKNTGRSGKDRSDTNSNSSKSKIPSDSEEMNFITIDDYLFAVRWYISLIPLLKPRIELHGDIESVPFEEDTFIQGTEIMQSIVDRCRNQGRSLRSASIKSNHLKSNYDSSFVLNKEIPSLSTKLSELERIFVDFKMSALTAVEQLSIDNMQQESALLQLEDCRSRILEMDYILIERTQFYERSLAGKDEEIDILGVEKRNLEADLLLNQKLLQESRQELLSFQDFSDSNMLSMKSMYEDEIAALQHSLSEFSDRMYDLNRIVHEQAASAESTRFNMQRALHVGMFAIEDERSAFVRAMEASVRMLQESERESAIQLSKIRANNVLLTHKYTALQSENSECSDLMSHFRSELSSAESKYKSMISSVEGKLWASLEENIRLQHEIAEANSKIQSLETKLDFLYKEKEVGDSSLRILKADHEHLKAQVQLDQERLGLSSEDAESCRYESVSQLAAMRQTLLKLTAKMVTQLDATECSAQSSDFMQQRLQMIIKSLQSEVCTLEADKRSLQCMLQDSNAELSSLTWARDIGERNIMRNYKENIDTYKLAVSVVNESNQYLRRKLEDMISETSSLDDGSGSYEWMPNPMILLENASSAFSPPPPPPPSRQSELEQLLFAYDHLIRQLNIGDEEIECEALVIILNNKFQLEVVAPPAEYGPLEENELLRGSNHQLQIDMDQLKQLHASEVERLSTMFDVEMRIVREKLQSLLACVKNMKAQSIEQRKAFDAERIALEVALRDSEMQFRSSQADQKSMLNKFEFVVENLKMRYEDMLSGVHRWRGECLQRDREAIAEIENSFALLLANSPTRTTLQEAMHLFAESLLVSKHRLLSSWEVHAKDSRSRTECAQSYLLSIPSAAHCESPHHPGETSVSTTTGAATADSLHAAPENTVSDLCATLEMTLREVYRIIYSHQREDMVACEANSSNWIDLPGSEDTSTSLPPMDQDSMPMNSVVSHLLAELRLFVQRLVVAADLNKSCSGRGAVESRGMNPGNLEEETHSPLQCAVGEGTGQGRRDQSTQSSSIADGTGGENRMAAVRKVCRENKRLKRLCSSQQICIMALRFDLHS